MNFLLIVLEARKFTFKVPEDLLSYEYLYLVDGTFWSTSLYDRKIEQVIGGLYNTSSNDIISSQSLRFFMLLLGVFDFSIGTLWDRDFQIIAS